MNPDIAPSMPAPTLEAPQVATMERPAINLTPATEFTVADNADLALLENAHPATPLDVEATLQTYTDNDIPEASYTIEEDTPAAAAPTAEAPVIQLTEPAAPTPPGAEQGQPQLTPDQITQQINTEISRQAGANADPATRAQFENRAYDQLVYAHPDRAQELAAAGNQAAAQALERRDKLVGAPQTSTALETRQPAAENKDKNEIVPLQPSEIAREAQASIVEVQHVIEQAGDKLPVEVRKSVDGLTRITLLLLLIAIQQMKEMRFEEKQALSHALAQAFEKKKKPDKEMAKTIGELIGSKLPGVEDKTPAPVERPQLEAAPAPLQIEAAPTPRQLMLPGPGVPASTLPAGYLIDAQSLPAPALEAIPAV